MLLRRLRLSLMVLATLVLTTDRAWPMGVILGQTKEELKLKYDVASQDHGTGRVTVVLTLADEGRLKPVYAVQLVIPGQKRGKDGGRYMDLVVSLDTTESDDGKRVARIHLRREMAERAEIWLTTSTFDGKQLAMTRYHHLIPLANYLKDSPAAIGMPDRSTSQLQMAKIERLIEQLDVGEASRRSGRRTNPLNR